MNEQFLLRKAESFVAHTKLCTLGSWKPVIENKPHLWQAISDNGCDALNFEQKCFKWDFMLMVAMAWWAVSSARIELPDSKFKSVALKIEQGIQNWNRGGISALEDLNKFICKYDSDYQNILDIKKIEDFTKILVGTWILWNLTNKNEFEDEADLAAMLGKLVHESVTGYWHEK